MVTEPDIASGNGVVQGLSQVITDLGAPVSPGQGLAGGIEGDYGPWARRAWREKVYGRLKPEVAARAERLEDFEGGWGIRIGPA